MSDLRPQVRTAIHAFLKSQQDRHIPSDILRVIQEEASLMKETEDVRDALTNDPYEQFEQVPPKALEQFKQSLQVTTCERVRGGADFARIHAVVVWPTANNMELTFLYERTPRRGFPPTENGDYPCQVTYTIDLAYNNGERQRLLEVQVWAPSSFPSADPAICIQNESDGDDDQEEDGWEDIDENDNVKDPKSTNGYHTRNDVTNKKSNKNAEAACSPDALQAKKKQKTRLNNMDESKNLDEVNKGKGQDIDRRDQYVSFLDPDVMQSFVESAGLLPIHDGTAFFLLTTFPFFDHEWDIVGFVLDQFFGDGDSDHDDDEQQ